MEKLIALVTTEVAENYAICNMPGRSDATVARHIESIVGTVTLALNKVTTKSTRKRLIRDVAEVLTPPETRVGDAYYYSGGCFWRAMRYSTGCFGASSQPVSDVAPLCYSPWWHIARRLSLLHNGFFRLFKSAMPWPDVIYVAATKDGANAIKCISDPQYIGYRNLYTFVNTPETAAYLTASTVRLVEINNDIGLIAAGVLNFGYVIQHVEASTDGVKHEMLLALYNIRINSELSTTSASINNGKQHVSYWITKNKGKSQERYTTTYLDALWYITN